jgi:hypothetical protein
MINHLVSIGKNCLNQENRDESVAGLTDLVRQTVKVVSEDITSAVITTYEDCCKHYFIIDVQD